MDRPKEIGEEEVEIPVAEEEVVVGKKPVVKESVQDEEAVEEDVRKEEISVDEDTERGRGLDKDAGRGRGRWIFSWHTIKGPRSSCMVGDPCAVRSSRKRMLTGKEDHGKTQRQGQ